MEPVTLPELFERQVAASPEAVALICGEQRVTYRQLAGRVNQLARSLAEAGVGPESVVALALPRSVDLVTAVLAVMTAGGAYLPIDPDYPAQRIAFMLNDTAPAMLITCGARAGEIPFGAMPLMLMEDLDSISYPTVHNPAAPAPAAARPGSGLACVMYTSSPAPRAVEISHAGLAELAAAYRRSYKTGDGDRLLQFASPGSGGLISELCLGLLTGACLVVPERGLVGDELVNVLGQQRITHLHVPARVLAGVPKVELPSLVTLILSDDTCPADTAVYWSHGRTLVNSYGSVELTMACTDFRVEPGEDLPVGRLP
ncbi:AMP-binding protein, partial [Rugosimonospora africana]|uniref:AMP-binding protein n=1 Tax=Rugosimonospora africana TaxID=556532 RepID=UPI0019430FD9